jgi:hypothetical protein
MMSLRYSRQQLNKQGSSHRPFSLLQLHAVCLFDLHFGYSHRLSSDQICSDRWGVSFSAAGSSYTNSSLCGLSPATLSEHPRDSAYWLTRPAAMARGYRRQRTVSVRRRLRRLRSINHIVTRAAAGRRGPTSGLHRGGYCQTTAIAEHELQE